MHVALLGSEQDPQIQHIAKALHQNNTPFYFANTQHFGSTWKISYDPDFDDGLIHFNRLHFATNLESRSRIPRPLIGMSTYLAYR